MTWSGVNFHVSPTSLLRLPALPCEGFMPFRSAHWRVAGLPSIVDSSVTCSCVCLRFVFAWRSFMIMVVYGGRKDCLVKRVLHCVECACDLACQVRVACGS